jgi:hypothetical protein
MVSWRHNNSSQGALELCLSSVREDRIFDVISLDLLGGFELVVILHYAIVLETRPPVGI